MPRPRHHLAVPAGRLRARCTRSDAQQGKDRRHEDGAALQDTADDATGRQRLAVPPSPTPPPLGVKACRADCTVFENLRFANTDVPPSLSISRALKKRPTPTTSSKRRRLLKPPSPIVFTINRAIPRFFILLSHSIHFIILTTIQKAKNERDSL